MGSILVTGLGAAALMKGPFPRANFFVAGVFVYMGTIVLEAVSMSLCSKVRPDGWAMHITYGSPSPTLYAHLCRMRVGWRRDHLAHSWGAARSVHVTPSAGLQWAVNKSR